MKTILKIIRLPFVLAMTPFLAIMSLIFWERVNYFALWWPTD